MPNIDWENLTVTDSTYPLSLCDLFINFMQEHGFSQSVNFPTCGNNILDNFITNRPSSITQCYPVSGVSYQEAVSVKSHVQVTVKSVRHRVHLWRRANLPVMKQIVSGRLLWSARNKDQSRELLKSACLSNKGTQFQTKGGISDGALRVTHYDSRGHFVYA